MVQTRAAAAAAATGTHQRYLMPLFVHPNLLLQHKLDSLLRSKLVRQLLQIQALVMARHWKAFVSLRDHSML